MTPLSSGHPLIGLNAVWKSRPGFAPPWWVGPGRVRPVPLADPRPGNYFVLGEAAVHWVKRSVL